MKFLSKIIFTFIFSIFIMALPSCSNNEKKVVVAEKKNDAKISIDSGDCFEMTFNTQKKLEFRDTTISLRRSIFKDMKVLICCDTNEISYELEKILLTSGYCLIDSVIDNYYIILDKSYENKKEIGLYYYESKQSWEARRFLVQGNEIIGIRHDPSVLTPFLTPEEYKNHSFNNGVD